MKQTPQTEAKLVQGWDNLVVPEINELMAEGWRPSQMTAGGTNGAWLYVLMVR